MYDVYVPVHFKELEIADEVKALRSHFQVREADDLCQISLAVAPVQCGNGNAPKPRRRITFPHFLWQIVQRDRSQTLSANYNACCFGIGWRWNRLDRTRAQSCGTIAYRAPEPRLLLAGKCARSASPSVKS